jgi:hypothetical protein
VDGTWLTAGASALTAVGGCVMAYAAVVSAKRKASADCQRELVTARAEAEQMAAEVHRLRMGQAQ